MRELLILADALARELDGHTRDIDYCRTKLALPPQVLDPPMLISGNDLCAAGYLAGPQFRDVLIQVRDAQLEGRVTNREQALALAGTLMSPAE
jgi:poly(A) polymerase